MRLVVERIKNRVSCWMGMPIQEKEEKEEKEEWARQFRIINTI